MKETGPRYGKIFICSDNSGQNIWNKVRTHNKIGQEFKNMISNFAFLESYRQRLVSGRKTRQ